MHHVDRLRFPIGPFAYDPRFTAAQRSERIEEIRRFPEELRAAIATLGEALLDATYREGAWSVRQLVHHIADGHVNSFFRFKLALTEDEPAVKTWDENLWAQTPEAIAPPIEHSLRIIEGTHGRWAWLLERMTEADFARVYVHPQNGRVHLDWLLQYMAWHGLHHLAHLSIVRERPLFATGQASAHA